MNAVCCTIPSRNCANRTKANTNSASNGDQRRAKPANPRSKQHAHTCMHEQISNRHSHARWKCSHAQRQRGTSMQAHCVTIFLHDFLPPFQTHGKRGDKRTSRMHHPGTHHSTHRTHTHTRGPIQRHSHAQARALVVVVVVASYLFRASLGCFSWSYVVGPTLCGEGGERVWREERHTKFKSNRQSTNQSSGNFMKDTFPPRMDNCIH